MNTIIIALVTFLVTASVYYIFTLSQKNGPFKWYLWAMIGLWFIWTIMGTSFVVLNAVDLHSKAAFTGAFLVYSVSAITGVLLARLIGLGKSFKFNLPKKAKEEVKV